MSRPESQYVTALKAFRERLVDARRAAAEEPNLDTALKRFTEIETAIGLVDRAMENEPSDTYANAVPMLAPRVSWSTEE